MQATIDHPAIRPQNQERQPQQRPINKASQIIGTEFIPLATLEWLAGNLVITQSTSVTTTSRPTILNGRRRGEGV